MSEDLKKMKKVTAKVVTKDGEKITYAKPVQRAEAKAVVEETSVAVAVKPAEETSVAVAVKPAEETSVAVAAEPAEETSVAVAAEPAEETSVAVAAEPAEETSVAVAAEPAEETSSAVAAEPVAPKAEESFVELEKPVEAKPVEAKTAETKTAETKAAETKTAEAKKPDTPVYKKWWLWAIVALVILFVWLASTGKLGGTTATTTTTTTETTATTTEEVTYASKHDEEAAEIQKQLAEKLDLTEEDISVSSTKDINKGSTWLYKAELEDGSYYCAAYDTKLKRIFWCSESGREISSPQKIIQADPEDYTKASYKDLSDKSSDYYQKKVQFTCKVLKVEDPDGLTVTLTVAYGDEDDDIAKISYSTAILDDLLGAGDKLTVYGTFKGLQSIETDDGDTLAAPFISADQIILQAEENSDSDTDD